MSVLGGEASQAFSSVHCVHTWVRKKRLMKSRHPSLTIHLAFLYCRVSVRVILEVGRSDSLLLAVVSSTFFLLPGPSAFSGTWVPYQHLQDQPRLAKSDIPGRL